MGASATVVADDGSNAVNRQQEQQIRSVLERTPDLENNRIVVTVDDGIAVLEGSVDSKAERKEAQQLAHVDGILGVNNRLKVAPGVK
jgi:osmotically-inducible protein OsmY